MADPANHEVAAAPQEAEAAASRPHVAGASRILVGLVVGLRG
jgi:hypothetical protein